MKFLSRLVVAGLALVVMLVPAGTLSEQLATPVTKTVLPPQETILYSGQSLRFTTDVPLKVQLSVVEPGKIRLKFKAAETGGNAPASTSVEVFWENFGNEIYEGSAPLLDPWDGILLTESGFTEK